MSIAGQGSSSFGAFVESPFHARSDGDEFFYVINTTTLRVYKLSSVDGSIVWTSAAFTNPRQLAVSPTGRLFVSHNSGDVAELDPETGSSLASYNGAGGSPFGCAAVSSYDDDADEIATDHFYNAGSLAAAHGVCQLNSAIDTERWEFIHAAALQQNTAGVAADSAGSSYWINGGDSPSYAFKLDNIGAQVWSKTYVTAVTGVAGEAGVTGIPQARGDYVFAFSSVHDASFPIPIYTTQIIRLSKSDGSDTRSSFGTGELTWTTSGHQIAVGASVAYFAQPFNVTPTSTSKFIKIDHDLNLLASFDIGVSALYIACAILNNGNVLFGGNRNSSWTGAAGVNANLFCFNSALTTMLWHADVGGTGIIRHIQSSRYITTD